MEVNSEFEGKREELVGGREEGSVAVTGGGFETIEGWLRRDVGCGGLLLLTQRMDGSRRWREREGQKERRALEGGRRSR
jgi:hypothetical protein